MGAQSGGHGEAITSINVTPLVDIMLVLLIIFMVTTSVITEQDKVMAIPLELPSGATSEELLSSGLLALTLDSDGVLYLNAEKASEDKVRLAVEAIRLRSLRPQALISADKRVAHGSVTELMDYLRQLGVTNIAINTKKQAIE